MGFNILDPFGISKKITNHLTGGPPKKSFLGGSEKAQDASRKSLEKVSAQSNQAGQAAFGQGLGTMSGAVGQSQADRSNAGAYANTGNDVGDLGIFNQNMARGQQNAMLGNLVGTAQHQGPSAAQAQLQQGLSQTQNAMMSQAANARGGNAASAMRTAQANGVEMAGNVNQQAAILRAQEAQQHQQNVLGAQQYAAGAYGGQQAVSGQTAALGYGMEGQGLGLAQGSTGQMAGIGADQASAGLGAQNVGVSAASVMSDRDKALLDADRGNASATTAANSPAAAFGGILGGVTQLWGGGGKK